MSSTANTITLAQALPAKIVRVSSTNLFRIAEKELGDATQAYRILALNPELENNYWISGVVEIKIPQPGISNGGIPTG